eukprot:RCo016052
MDVERCAEKRKHKKGSIGPPPSILFSSSAALFLLQSPNSLSFSPSLRTSPISEHQYQRKGVPGFADIGRLTFVPHLEFFNEPSLLPKDTIARVDVETKSMQCRCASGFGGLVVTTTTTTTTSSTAQLLVPLLFWSSLPLR